MREVHITFSLRHFVVAFVNCAGAYSVEELDQVVSVLLCVLLVVADGRTHVQGVGIF